MSDSFDRWLEDELDSGLSRAAGSATPAEPRYRTAGTSPRVSKRLSLFAGLPVALSAKAAAGLAVAALAAGGTAAVMVSSHQGGGSDQSQQQTLVKTESSSSSSSQTNHGAAVTDAVASCKAALETATPNPTTGKEPNGIGQCVSDVANGGKSHPTGNSDTHSDNGADHANGGSSDSHPTPPAHPTPPPHPTPHTH